MKLPHPPSIATVPLGTGNNLHFSFGWVSFSLLHCAFDVFLSSIYMFNNDSPHIIYMLGYDLRINWIK